MKAGPKPRPLVDRFMSLVEPCPATGCWLWLGSCQRYGQVYVSPNRGRQLAHRVSWELFIGEVRSDQNVLHRCDVPLCVNPGHLFLGTQSDNHSDMAGKGRECYDGLALGRLPQHRPRGKDFGRRVSDGLRVWWARRKPQEIA